MCHFKQLHGQDNNIQSAINYLKYKDIDIAKKYIDKAALFEATANSPKMWLYRGKIYKAMAEDTVWQHLDTNALEKATASFINCIETDTKKRYKDRAANFLFNCAPGLYNIAVVAYSNDQHEKAIRIYRLILDIIPYDKNKNLVRNNISAEILYYNSYLAANKGKDNVKAKSYLQKLMDLNYNDPNIYIYMSQMLLEEKDTATALSFIEKGRGIFEENSGLINEELNIYIMQGKTDILIEKLTNAIANDPEYELLYFNRGTLYDKTGQTQKAIEDYKKALELDPEFFDGLYNLGALHYNAAIEIGKQMIRLSYSQQSKYNKLKNQQDELFTKALPYLEKAYNLNDKDLGTLIALKEIYAKTGNYTKSKEMKQKILEQQNEERVKELEKE